MAEWLALNTGGIIMGEAKRRGTFEERLANPNSKQKIKVGMQELNDLIIFLDSQRRVDCNEILKEMNRSCVVSNGGKTVVYDGEIIQKAIRKRNEIIAMNGKKSIRVFQGDDAKELIDLWVKDKAAGDALYQTGGATKYL